MCDGLNTEIVRKSDYAMRPLVGVPPPPFRFTMSEWHLHNQQRTRLAEDQSQLAERIGKETERIKTQVGEILLNNRQETDHRIEERIAHLQFMADEIEKCRKTMQMELEALGVAKERMKDCLENIKTVTLKICQKILLLREGRLGIDMVQDNVEDEIRKEMKVVEGAVQLLTKGLEQVNEMMRELRSILYLLNRDMEDKLNTLALEKDVLNMKETNLDLSTYHGTTPLDAGSVTVDEWQRFSTDSIVKGYKHINTCRPFRTHVYTLLTQVMDDLKAQYNTVNEAFRKRIEELKDAKTKLEAQHFEVVRQANEMTRNVTALEVAIAEKEGFLALAHTRLGKRTQRPRVELVRDEVEARLVNEVVEVRQQVAKL